MKYRSWIKNSPTLKHTKIHYGKSNSFFFILVVSARYPGDKSGEVTFRLSKNNIFCAIKMVLLKILRRKMHTNYINTFKTRIFFIKYMKLVPVFLFCIISSTICADCQMIVITWLQLLKTVVTFFLNQNKTAGLNQSKVSQPGKAVRNC